MGESEQYDDAPHDELQPDPYQRDDSARYAEFLDFRQEVLMYYVIWRVEVALPLSSGVHHARHLLISHVPEVAVLRVRYHSERIASHHEREYRYVYYLPCGDEDCGGKKNPVDDDFQNVRPARRYARRRAGICTCGTARQFVEVDVGHVVRRIFVLVTVGGNIIGECRCRSDYGYRRQHYGRSCRNSRDYDRYVPYLSHVCGFTSVRYRIA